MRGEVSTFSCVLVGVKEVVMILRSGLPGLIPEMPVEVFPHVVFILSELERGPHSTVGASSLRVGWSALNGFVLLAQRPPACL